MRQTTTVLLLTLITVDVGSAQSPLEPEGVVLFSKVLNSDSNSTRLKIVDVAEYKGRWAAIVRQKSNDGSPVDRIVTGIGAKHSAIKIISGRGLDVTFDLTGRLHVFQYRRNTEANVDVLTWPDLNHLETYRVPSATRGALILNGSLRWHLGGGRFHRASDFDSTGQLREDRRFAVTATTDPDQWEWFLSVSGDRFVRVGSLREDISVFTENGELVAKAEIDLNTAYQRLGKNIVRFPLEEGRSRIVWVGTRGEKLYVQLSELPAAGPACVAVIHAETGSFVDLVKLQLPTVESRRTVLFPTGQITPSKGRVGEDGHVVLVDEDAAVLALYRMK
jgi:hypothetical protein